MILTMDIGNTNIKNGLFEGSKNKKMLTHSWRMSTERDKTADELGLMMKGFFEHVGHDTQEVEGIMISSVIPSINYTIEHMCSLYFPVPPLFVGPGIKTGMLLRYESPRELGADRICNAVAAYHIYQGPCITVDFGTATSFGVVSRAGDFLGGVICPGVKISADALVEKTAKLPKVELVKPPSIIGKNTVQCIQAGLIYGYVGQVDYILERLMAELDEEDVKLIATGGMANLLTGESKYLREIHSTLTLEGLRILYEINAR